MQQCTDVQNSKNYVDKPSAGRSVIHWSASIQHVVGFTRTVHRVLYTAWRTPCTLHCMEDTMDYTRHGGHHGLYTAWRTPCTLHGMEDTMYSTRHGGHHVHYTAWWTPCTLHGMEDTMYSTRHGRHHVLYTAWQTPCTLHCIEDTMYSMRHGGHHVLSIAWRAPCTVHCMEDTMYSTLHGGCMRTCSVCKNCQFFQYQIEVKQFKFRSTSADTTRWQHLGLVQHKIAKTVSSFSLQ